MTFSFIVAVSQNNVIGLKGQMPWKKLPADLKYFKQKTIGHWCILGRKTYEALGNKVLPGRKFIIITRDPNYSSNDSIIVNSLVKALHHDVIKNEAEVFILGGGEIFKETLHIANKIYLTRIHEVFDGDTFFPEINMKEWNLASKVTHSNDEKNPYDYTFLVYERK